MHTAKSIADTRAWCRLASTPHILVPTMGALHEGHLALIRQARLLAGPSGTVTVSIFVNPIQFGPTEDLSRYPRPFEQDSILCREAGADLLFHPSVEEMYASDASVKIEEHALGKRLCGASRPGHFSGMATVVGKLFNIITPTMALFGEKDWQQLAIIRRFVRDLNFPIEIQGHPIVREEDGLARSSRNIYLTADERAEAPKIYQALQSIASLAKEGMTDTVRLLEVAQTELSKIPKVRLDYIDIVNEVTLQPLSKLIEGAAPARLLVALFLGKTRLIDNISLAAL